MSKYRFELPEDWAAPNAIYDFEFAPILDEDGVITKVAINTGEGIYPVDPMEIMSLANTLQALFPYLHMHPSEHPDLIVGTGTHAPVVEEEAEPEEIEEPSE